MILWLLLFTGFLFIFALRKWSYFKPPKYLEDMPMPDGGSFLWGHEKLVFENSVGSMYSRWLNDLRTHVMRIRGALFKSDIIVLSDPLAISYIMKQRIYDYPHSAVVRPRIARLLGKSLGWVEGESEHQRMRQLLSPSLAPDTIKRGAQEVFTAAETLADNLEKHLTSRKKTTVNIIDWVNKATLDIIGRFGFGHDFKGGSSEDALNIMGAWRSMAKLAISTKGFYALMLMRRFPILNSLPLKALKAQGEVRLTIHRGVARELFRRDKASIFTAGNDLLSRILSAYTNGQIPLEELMDHISMFIMAGSETTSQSLGYAIWELAKNPNIQSRLREEVENISNDLSYDTVKDRMPYLDAVTRETLRLHPAAPYMERVSLKDDTLPLRYPLITSAGESLRQLTIKAGQTIIIPIHSINREAAVWGDGDSFRPERWQQELPSKDSLTKGWSNLLTFSDGPRNCIGFRLALFQFKVILLTLVLKFDFQDTGKAITNRLASSMQPVVVGEEEFGPQLPIKVMVY